jgi:hypothetical protein
MPPSFLNPSAAEETRLFLFSFLKKLGGRIKLAIFYKRNIKKRSTKKKERIFMTFPFCAI